MRSLIGLVVILGCLLLAAAAPAVDIQYLLSNGHVTGVSDTPLTSVEGYGLVTLPGATAAQIIWPIPAVCAAGKPGWTAITDPANVTVSGGGMAVQSALIFFSTTSPLLPACQPVTSWKALKRLMDETLLSAALAEDLVQALAGVNTWKQELCPESNVSANCVQWRANMDTVNARYPGRGQGVTLSGDMATLVQDTYAFKEVQCTAQPGGPFC
jgi:hypothetical protein